MLNLSSKSFIAIAAAALSYGTALAQQPTKAFMRPGASEPCTAYMWDCIDQSPRFPGGDNAMIRFINAERVYPSEAYNAGVQDRVRCGFIVDVDGSISNITVHRGHNRELNREAVRIISNMPKWEAGTFNGAPVATYVMITIPFRL